MGVFEYTHPDYSSKERMVKNNPKFQEWLEEAKRRWGNPGQEMTKTLVIIKPEGNTKENYINELIESFKDFCEFNTPYEKENCFLKNWNGGSPEEKNKYVGYKILNINLDKLTRNDAFGLNDDYDYTTSPIRSSPQRWDRSWAPIIICTDNELHRWRYDVFHKNHNIDDWTQFLRNLTIILLKE